MQSLLTQIPVQTYFIKSQILSRKWVIRRSTYGSQSKKYMLAWHKNATTDAVIIESETVINTTQADKKRSTLMGKKKS